MRPGRSIHPVSPAGHPVIITRRIQILLQADDKEQWKASYKKLCGWQRIVSKAANWIATHHFVQENLKDLTYLTDGAKIKLANVNKDEEGILNTSRISTTYRLLSGKFKGQIPMAIISSLNNRITSVFDKEKGEYREGKRSLRTYKQDLPIPIASSDIIHISPVGISPVDHSPVDSTPADTPAAKGDYTFTLYGLHFRTHFGRDASGNRAIFERALRGEYKLCNSTIEIRKNKLFLLAVFSFDKVEVPLSEDIRVTAHLSIDIPILAESGGQQIQIGSREEYLYRRLAIQESMHRIQSTMRYNIGGKGRNKKMQALDRFHRLEKNYVDTRLHQYSARLVAFCLQQRAGVLVLQSQTQKETEAKENEFLIRNWTYHGLKEKILYKAGKYGIAVIIE